MKNVLKAFGTQIRWICAIALIAVIGFSFTACDDGSGGDIPPEDKPVQDRWGKWVAEDSTATLEYSVDDDGVCTITVGGTAQPNNETDGWGRWKASAQYAYTARAGKNYEYTFEAWTESGTRNLHIQYYNDTPNGVWKSDDVSITTTPTTYTIYGEPLPTGGIKDVEFQCADQLGTFYVKILEIKEYTVGKLTIINFSGSPGLSQGSDVSGSADVSESTSESIELYFCGSASFIDGILTYYTYGYTYGVIKGNTLTIPVWEVNWDKKTVVPYAGNITLSNGYLELVEETFTNSGQLTGCNYYANKVPITFTNGNATINFGTQMEFKRHETP